MFLSTKGRYAVIAMTSLALSGSRSYLSVINISEREKISRTFLEQLFMRLRQADLVKSRRGPAGGYRLARSPHEIPISDILEAVNEPISASEKGKGASGGLSGTQAQSLTNRLWEGLSTEVNVYLHRVTLKDIVNNRISPCPAVILLQNTGFENRVERPPSIS